MSRSVVVVGAGMGGLSAAVALSGRPGWDVTVLEAASEPGGKAGVMRHDGVAVDTGPSLLTLPSVVDDLLQRRGRRLAEELNLFQPEPTARYHFADGTRFDVAPTVEETTRNVRRALGASAARQFEDFLEYSRTIWEAASPHFVFGPAPTALSAVKLGVSAMRDLMAIDSTKTMIKTLDAKISDRRLRDLFLRYATFNGSDPRCAPATLHCIGWVDLGLGGWGVEGGIFALVEMLEGVATEGGVDFVYDTPVTSIRRRGNRFELQASEQRFEADAVVVNADVHHFVHDLWDGTEDPGVRIDEEPSASGWVGVFKARRKPSDQRPAHNIVFGQNDYMQEFEDLFDRRAMPTDPTIYVCSQQKAHRTEGWEDHEPLFVMTQAPPVDEQGSGYDCRRHRRRVVSRLCEKGLIDEDDELIWCRRPRDLAERFPGSRGSIYGMASNSRLAAFKRPPNRVPGIDGVYLAGGGAHPGGGVPLCVQSGRQAVKELLEDYG